MDEGEGETLNFWNPTKNIRRKNSAAFCSNSILPAFASSRRGPWLVAGGGGIGLQQSNQASLTFASASVGLRGRTFLPPHSISLPAPRNAPARGPYHQQRP